MSSEEEREFQGEEVKLLVEKLGRSGTDVTLIAAITKFGDQAVPHLLIKWQSEDWSVKGVAAKALNAPHWSPSPGPDNILFRVYCGTYRDPSPEDIPNLIRLASHPLDTVRLQVASALGLLPDARSFGALAGMLLDRQQSVQRAAESALGRCGDNQAVEPLSRFLLSLKERHYSGNDPRVVAIALLGQIRNDASARALGEVLTWKPGYLGEKAADQLGGFLSNAAAVDALTSGLKQLQTGGNIAVGPLPGGLPLPEDNVRVVFRIVTALQQTADPRAIGPLLRLAQDFRFARIVTDALYRMLDVHPDDAASDDLSLVLDLPALAYDDGSEYGEYPILDTSKLRDLAQAELHRRHRQLPLSTPAQA